MSSPEYFVYEAQYNANKETSKKKFSIRIGAWVWGIAGMIIFLPFAAMFKVFCEEYEELKPVALLMGEQNFQKKNVHDKYISKWVKKIKDLFSKILHNFKKK